MKKWRISGYQKLKMAKRKVSKWSDIHFEIYAIRTNKDSTFARKTKMY